MSATKENVNHIGLTDEEVRQSRAAHGVNLLTPPKRPSLFKLYLEKFQDPVVKVLLVAALFSLIISIVENEYAETIGIIAAILLATGIGFFFEYDANRRQRRNAGQGNSQRTRTGSTPQGCGGGRCRHSGDGRGNACRRYVARGCFVAGK